MVEEVREQRLRHVSSAYLTYVAVDRDGKGISIPRIVAETEHQKRRYDEAGRRREIRVEETSRKREMRMALGEGWHL
jgi:acyl-CoA hydrolase